MKLADVDAELFFFLQLYVTVEPMFQTQIRVKGTAQTSIFAVMNKDIRWQKNIPPGEGFMAGRASELNTAFINWVTDCPFPVLETPLMSELFQAVLFWLIIDNFKLQNAG